MRAWSLVDGPWTFSALEGNASVSARALSPASTNARNAMTTVLRIQILTRGLRIPHGRVPWAKGSDRRGSGVTQSRWLGVPLSPEGAHLASLQTFVRSG